MKKTTALMLALVLCVSLLSACGGNSGAETSPPATAPSATAPPATQPPATEPGASGPEPAATSEPAPGVKEYKVPSVLGYTVEELENNKAVLGDFRLEVSDAVYSGDYREGVICGQSPEAGSMVREGEMVITVKISAGSDRMYMPSVTGRDAREALRLLQDEMGLTVDAQEEFSDTVAQGYVTRCLPMEGVPVEKGDKVAIWVSRGPETLKVTVPNLINARIEDVGRQITGAGLTLSEVLYFYNDEYPEGRVFWQSMEPYREVDKSTGITLWVSKGPAETAQPSQNVASSQPEVNMLTGFTLNSYDITLNPKGTANDRYQLKITFDPAGWTGEVTWESSDERYATVDQYGVVTNVNATTSLRAAVITVTAGGISKECKVYCKGVPDEPAAPDGPAGDPPSPSGSGAATVGKKGVVANTGGNGVYVRAEPGASGEKLASLFDGDPVTVLENAGNGWYKISFHGAGNADMEGYIKGDYISTD